MPAGSRYALNGDRCSRSEVADGEIIFQAPFEIGVRETTSAHQIESDVTAMKKSAKEQREFGIVRRDGSIVLPPCVRTFKLGQRVYFYVGKEGVVFRAQPKGIFRGRMLSSRIRRGLRSLASYGPRALASRRRR